jgi:hypothetical protein
MERDCDGRPWITVDGLMPLIPQKSANKQQLSLCKWVNDGLVRMFVDRLGFQDGCGLQIRVQEFDSPTRLQ